MCYSISSVYPCKQIKFDVKTFNYLDGKIYVGIVVFLCILVNFVDVYFEVDHLIFVRKNK